MLGFRKTSRCSNVCWSKFLTIVFLGSAPFTSAWATLSEQASEQAQNEQVVQQKKDVSYLESFDQGTYTHDKNFFAASVYLDKFKKDSATNNIQTTLLHLAIARQDKDKTYKLLKQMLHRPNGLNFNVNTKDSFGYTPLYLALRFWANNDGFWANNQIDAAAGEREFEGVIEKLLSLGADPNTYNNRNETILHQMMQFSTNNENNVRVNPQFFQRSFDWSEKDWFTQQFIPKLNFKTLNMRDFRGHTPLVKLALSWSSYDSEKQQQLFQMFKLLVSYGANPNDVDEHGRSIGMILAETLGLRLSRAPSARQHDLEVTPWLNGNVWLKSLKKQGALGSVFEILNYVFVFQGASYKDVHIWARNNISNDFGIGQDVLHAVYRNDLNKVNQLFSSNKKTFANNDSRDAVMHFAFLFAAHHNLAGMISLLTTHLQVRDSKHFDNIGLERVAPKFVLDNLYEAVSQGSADAANQLIDLWDIPVAAKDLAAAIDANHLPLAIAFADRLATTYLNKDPVVRKNDLFKYSLTSTKASSQAHKHVEKKMGHLLRRVLNNHPNAEFLTRLIINTSSSAINTISTRGEKQNVFHMAVSLFPPQPKIVNELINQYRHHGNKFLYEAFKEKTNLYRSVLDVVAQQVQTEPLYSLAYQNILNMFIEGIRAENLDPDLYEDDTKPTFTPDEVTRFMSGLKQAFQDWSKSGGLVLSTDATSLEKNVFYGLKHEFRAQKEIIIKSWEKFFEPLTQKVETNKSTISKTCQEQLAAQPPAAS